MDFDKATRTSETCVVIPTPVVILILLNLIMYKLQIVRARFQNFVCLTFCDIFSFALLILQRLQIILALRARAILLSLKIYSCLFTPNCTWNHVSLHRIALHYIELCWYVWFHFCFFFLWLSPYWFPQSYLRYWTLQKRNIIHLNKTAKQLVRKTSYSVNYPWQIAPRTLSSLTTNSLMKISTYFKFEGEWHQ